MESISADTAEIVAYLDRLLKYAYDAKPWNREYYDSLEDDNEQFCADCDAAKAFRFIDGLPGVLARVPFEFFTRHEQLHIADEFNPGAKADFQMSVWPNAVRAVRELRHFLVSFIGLSEAVQVIRKRTISEQKIEEPASPNSPTEGGETNVKQNRTKRGHAQPIS